MGGDGSDTESSNSDAPALVATAHSASSSVLASSLSLVSDPASWTAEVFNAFVAEAQVIVQAAYASALGDAQRVRLVEMVLSLPEGIRLSTQKDFDMPPDVELCKLVQSRSRIADEAYGWAMGLEEAVLKNIHVFRCAVAPSSNLVGDTCIVEPPRKQPRLGERVVTTPASAPTITSNTQPSGVAAGAAGALLLLHVYAL